MTTASSASKSICSLISCSVTLALCEVIELVNLVKISGDFGFGLDYARTLAEWRERFWNVWDKVEPLGFDTRFKRLWEFYLFYCEAGFRAKNIDVRQIVYE